MGVEDEAGTETPYALAKRLHSQGTASPEVERALRESGLNEDEARIAARAARGEAGFALSPSAPGEVQQSELPSQPPSEAPAHPCPAHAEWPVLATCSRCGKFICARCLSEAGLLRMPESKQCPTCESRSPTAPGIGGWLILPALHVGVAAPLSLIAGLVQDAAAIPKLSGELLPPVLIELVGNGAMLAWSIYVAIHFFRRKQQAVGLMVMFYVTMVLTALMGMMLSAWLESITGKQLDAASSATTQTIRTFISSLIWISYFRQSKRVKQTFVVP